MQEIARHEFIECICHDPAHAQQLSLLFWADPDDPDKPTEPELYFHTQLNHRYGFWGRLWNAIHYVLGRKSVFGHWSEGTIGYEQLPRVKELIELTAAAWEGYYAAYPHLRGQ